VVCWNVMLVFSSWRTSRDIFISWYGRTWKNRWMGAGFSLSVCVCLHVLCACLLACWYMCVCGCVWACWFLSQCVCVCVCVYTCLVCLSTCWLMPMSYVCVLMHVITVCVYKCFVYLSTCQLMPMRLCVCVSASWQPVHTGEPYQGDGGLSDAAVGTVLSLHTGTKCGKSFFILLCCRHLCFVNVCLMKTLLSFFLFFNLVYFILFFNLV
jgi:hypothetical protein